MFKRGVKGKREGEREESDFGAMEKGGQTRANDYDL